MVITKEFIKSCSLSRKDLCKELNIEYSTFNSKLNSFLHWSKKKNEEKRIIEFINTHQKERVEA